MKTAVILFGAAAICNGASWAGLLLGQAEPASIFELVQLGGTGGLVVCLVGAIGALWKERVQLRREWKTEVQELRGIISGERQMHREEMNAINTRHAEIIQELSDKYTDELKQQIETLRAEYSAKPKGSNDG